MTNLLIFLKRKAEHAVLCGFVFFSKILAQSENNRVP